MIQIIRDYVTCLTRAGFTHFFFINGHGGRCHAQAAFADIPHLIDLNIPNAHLVHVKLVTGSCVGLSISLAEGMHQRLARLQRNMPIRVDQTSSLIAKGCIQQNLRTS